MTTCAPGTTTADPDERRWRGGTGRATHLIALPTPADTDRTSDGTSASASGEESAS